MSTTQEKFAFTAASRWMVVRTASATRPSIAFAYVPFVLGINVITFIENVSRYPLAQLTIDLLILYPLAALIGGLAAARGWATRWSST